jgi:hypothetical protein
MLTTCTWQTPSTVVDTKLYYIHRNCGDQDSIGVFQQRPSQGWGTYDQIMDVTYSTGKASKFIANS